MNTSFQQVFFIDSLHGWIEGLPPHAILRTTDGGASWQRYPTPYSFDALTFCDPLHGWGGVAGIFFRTTDGGITWDSLFSVNVVGNDFGVLCLSFSDTVYGWAFGSQSWQGIITEAIYHTTDGGETWYQESIGLTDDLGDLSQGIMLDRHHGWAFAHDGRVLAYELVTSVAERLPDRPSGYALRQNYPNPFNSSTTIQYELPQREHVELRVFDALGRLAMTLVNETQPAGVYQVRVDASRLSSQIYFYSLKAGDFQATKSMTFLGEIENATSVLSHK